MGEIATRRSGALLLFAVVLVLAAAALTVRSAQA